MASTQGVIVRLIVAVRARSAGTVITILLVCDKPVIASCGVMAQII
jgi:hypothetical protein